MTNPSDLWCDKCKIVWGGKALKEGWPCPYCNTRLKVYLLDKPDQEEEMSALNGLTNSDNWREIIESGLWQYLPGIPPVKEAAAELAQLKEKVINVDAQIQIIRGLRKIIDADSEEKRQLRAEIEKLHVDLDERNGWIKEHLLTAHPEEPK